MLKRVLVVNPPVRELAELPEAEEVTFVPLEAVWPDGRQDFSRRISAQTDGYTRFRRGDILVPKITPTFEAGRVVVADDLGTEFGLGTTELHVLRTTPLVEPRYIAYLLRSEPVLQEGTTMLQGVGNLRRVPPTWIEKYPLPVIDLRGQCAIADFLDRETAKIDALIEKQNALIDCLRERRRHVIDQALQPSAGQTRVPLKRLLRRLDQGISPDTASGTDEAEFWVLKSGASNNGVFNEMESKPVPEAIHIPPGIELAPGDLVVSRASGSPGLVGSAAQVGALSRRLILSDKTFRLVPGSETDTRFLYWSLNSPRYRAQVLLAISGADGLANNLPVSSLKRFSVWAPPLAQQRSLAEHLDREIGRVDSLISKAERFVELVRERRSALITAAVTEQIDVSREGAA